jgi:hypothetical protein
MAFAIIVVMMWPGDATKSSVSVGRDRCEMEGGRVENPGAGGDGPNNDGVGAWADQDGKEGKERVLEEAWEEGGDRERSADQVENESICKQGREGIELAKRPPNAYLLFRQDIHAD